jgi:hypothetical protein
MTTPSAPRPAPWGPLSMPALRIETPRLLLRPPEAGDFDAFADHCADPHAMATLGGPQPRPVAAGACIPCGGKPAFRLRRGPGSLGPCKSSSSDLSEPGWRRSRYGMRHSIPWLTPKPT